MLGFIAIILGSIEKVLLCRKISYHILWKTFTSYRMVVEVAGEEVVAVEAVEALLVPVKIEVLSSRIYEYYLLSVIFIFDAAS